MMIMMMTMSCHDDKLILLYFIPRNNAVQESPRESVDSSNMSSTGSESVDSGNEKKTKHVTFDKMVAEPKQTDHSFRKRKHREKHAPKLTQPFLLPKNGGRSDESILAEPMQMDEIDLCALLESIPKDVPKVETKEEKELTEVANRLSAYDNMSFDDKKDFAVVQRQNSDESATRCEGTPSPQRTPISTRSKRNSYDGSSCKMCGLLGKKRSRSSEDVYMLNTI